MKKTLLLYKTVVMAMLLLLPITGWTQGVRRNVKTLPQLNMTFGLGKLHDRSNLSPRMRLVPRAGSVFQQPAIVHNTDGTPVTLYGAVSYNRAWHSEYTADNMPYGVYSFPLEDGFSLTQIVAGTPGARPNYGAYITPSAYGMINWNETEHKLTYYAFNLSDGSLIKEQLLHDVTLMTTCSAYDPTSGRIYGCLFNANQDGYNFGYVDYDNMTSTVIKQNTLNWVAMAFNSKGKLFAIDTNGGLYTIDLSTGEPSLIGNIGFKPTPDIQSACFDMSDDKLYFFGSNNEIFGIYEVNTTTGVATRQLRMGGIQLAALYIPYQESTNGAPARLSDLRAVFDKASTTGALLFTIPTKTYDQKALTGTVHYTAYLGENVLATGNGDAGSAVSIPVEAKEGMNIFSVVLSNDAGESPKNRISSWAGYDVPETVRNCGLTIDSITHKASVSWSAPTKCIHGGYLDANNLTYDIVRYPDRETVAKGLNDTTFTEELPDNGLKIYSYGVTVSNGTKKSDEVRTDEVVAGDAAEVPYSESFGTETSFKTYKVVDANHDGATWQYDAEVKAASSQFSDVNAADDWLVTPPIQMKAGKVYRFSAHIYDADYANYFKQRFEVAFGQGTDPSTYTNIISPTNLLQYDPKAKFSGTVTVKVDGNYHFAIHDISDKDQAYISVDDISVIQTGTKEAPDSVSALKLTPGERGNLSATLEFIAPQKDLTGNNLSSLTKIDVYRNDSVLVKSFSNPNPGSSLSVIDNSPVNGNNIYTVVPFNSAGEGMQAFIRSYVGQDSPNDPSHVYLSDADSKVSLHWTAPSEQGRYGGFVRPEELRYQLYQNNEYGDLALAFSDVTGTEKTLDIDNTGDQNMIYWGVMAQNDYGYSNTIVSPALIVGTPYEMPFHEGFAGGSPENSLWWMTANPSNGMRWYVANDQSSDGDGFYVGWYPQTPGASCSINTGKISTANASHPVLSFDYWAIPGVDAKLSVLANVGDTVNTVLQEINYQTLEGDLASQGWRRVYVDLPVGHPYVIVKFLATSNNVNAVVGIDNINVRNVLDRDLTVMLDAPAEVKRGENTSYGVTVKNVGVETIDDYQVNLFVNGKKVSTVEGSSIGRDASEVFSLYYAAPVTSTEDLAIYATVTCDDDDDSNNTSETSMVTVNPSTMKSIDDLTATVDGANVNLKWSPISGVVTRTEDFESYTPFVASEVLGDWKTIDLDGSDSYNVWEMSSNPVCGDELPDAFTIFNPSAYNFEGAEGLDLELYPYLTAHSGNQYAGSLCSMSGKNDDWLISPILSGAAQTIKFFVKSYYSDYQENEESYQVLYSLSDTAIANFKLLEAATIKGTEDASWREVSYNLPIGTKYFAIRCVSEDMSLFMVDDITFDADGGSPIGYRIYRDGQLIGQVDYNVTTYEDRLVEDGRHVYCVTALYAKGESGLSNEAVVDIITAVRSIGYDSSHKNVYNLNGMKVKSPHQGIYIYGKQKRAGK